MGIPWNQLDPVFVDPTSPEDPVIQILAGWESELAKSTPEEQRGPRTPATAMAMCYRNCLHLYRTATLASASGEYGAARAMIILALEEFGKAFSYMLLNFGVYGTDPDRRGKRPYFDRNVLRCHKCKQGLIFAVEIGWAVALAMSLFPALEQFDGDDGDIESVISAIGGMIQKAITNPPTQKEIFDRLKAVPATSQKITNLFADRKTMEETKLKGLYVDFERNPPTWPQTVTETEYERVRSFVAEKLVGSSRVFVMELPTDITERIRPALAAIPFPPTEILHPGGIRGAEHPCNAKQMMAYKSRGKSITPPPVLPPFASPPI